MIHWWVFFPLFNFKKERSPKNRSTMSTIMMNFEAMELERQRPSMRLVTLCFKSAYEHLTWKALSLSLQVNIRKPHALGLKSRALSSLRPTWESCDLPYWLVVDRANGCFGLVMHRSCDLLLSINCNRNNCLPVSRFKVSSYILQHMWYVPCRGRTDTQAQGPCRPC